MNAFFSWTNYRTRVRLISHKYLELPTARALTQIGFSPNMVSISGLLISILSAYLLWTGQFVSGGIVIGIAGILDALDGSMSRLGDRATAQGSLLDSSIDRISESIIFLGLLAFYSGSSQSTEMVLVYCVLAGSFMVSYLRAKGESLNIQCAVGIMTRPERLVVLILGLITGFVIQALSLILILTFVTSVHRYIHIHNRLRDG